MFPVTHNKLLDWLERSVWSFIQGGVGALPIMLALTNDQGHAVILAAISGGLASWVTFIKAFFLNNEGPHNINPIANIVERFGWTFAAAFVGTLPATANLSRTVLGTIWTAGLAAGIAAVFSLAKNLTGTNVITQTLKMVPAGPPGPPGPAGMMAPAVTVTGGTTSGANYGAGTPMDPKGGWPAAPPITPSAI